MKRTSTIILAASLLLAVCGCKPDAAVKRGAIVDAGPKPEEKAKPGQPVVVPAEKKIIPDPSLKKVQ